MWVPIIGQTTLKADIFECLDYIIEELKLSSETTWEPGVTSGSAGISLFWAYLYANTGVTEYRSYCKHHVNYSLNYLSHNTLPYNFSNGIAGILWAFIYLSKSGVIDTKIKEKIGKEINDFLSKAALTDISRNNYDYLHGGLGVLLYYLENLENDSIDSSIHSIIGALKDISRKKGDQVAWIDGLTLHTENREEYNLGLAHGMPSIIVILSRLIQRGIKNKHIYEMLQGAINWLLEQKNIENAEYYFQCFAQSHASVTPVKLSWCYGDLGISVALLQASLILENRTLRDEAICIALKTVKRRNDAESGIRDGIICHGYTGNAHIYNRLYQYTLIGEFKESALHWYFQTANFFKKRGHLMHFSGPNDDNTLKWGKKYGILEGLAGIGLGLVASVSNIEPGWDRLLLLS